MAVRRARIGTPAMLAALALPAMGQQAIVAVTHNDPDGVVSPGETVQITTTVSWTGSNVYGLGQFRGSVSASPNIGISTNLRFPTPYITNPIQTINPGVPFGGSAIGINVDPAVLYWVLQMVPIGWPWYVGTGIDVHRFDWTAPSDLVTVSFGFEGDPMLPDPTFAVSGGSAPLIPLPTTYLGTSLTFIPAPASAGALGLGLLGGAGLGRRRR